MIFRQMFDSVSGTYSYLLASRAGGEALILDPVLEKVDRYCQLLRELDLQLEIARRTLRQDFRNIRPESARIVLLEGSPNVLGTFPLPLGEAARRSLTTLGVEVIRLPSTSPANASWSFERKLEAWRAAFQTCHLA